MSHPFAEGQWCRFKEIFQPIIAEYCYKLKIDENKYYKESLGSSWSKLTNEQVLKAANSLDYMLRDSVKDIIVLTKELGWTKEKGELQAMIENQFHNCKTPFDLSKPQRDMLVGQLQELVNRQSASQEKML